VQASALFKALQTGTLDRSGLGQEYSVFANASQSARRFRGFEAVG